MSGKSSPSSFSGSNSPCPTIEESKQLGRTNLKSPEQRAARDSRKKIVKNEDSEASLQAAKERKFEQLLKDSQPLVDPEPLQKLKSISLENLNQVNDSPADQFQPFFAIPMRDGETQTEGIEDDNLTLLEYITKYCTQQAVASPVKSAPIVEVENSKETSTPNVECQVIPTTPSLSDVLKPLAKSDEPQKPVDSSAPTKQAVKAPVRANYSLRNQTITSKNSKVAVESTARKLSATAAVRPSRPTTTLKSATQSVSSAPKQTTKTVPVRSKTMIEIPKQQQKFSIRSGELRKKKSLEDNTTDSSTSTLKASTERLGSRNSVRGSGEIKKPVTKPKPPGNGAGDGWMTVKSNKRRTSWSNQRFDQPSASASLPTLLALLNENVEETQKEPSTTEASVKALKPANENVKNIPAKPAPVKPVEQKKEHPKIKPASAKTKPVMSALAQSKKITSAVKAKVQCNAPSKRVTVNEKPKAPPVVKLNQQNIKRQKSDLTGLNLKTLRKEYLRREKFTPRKDKDSEDEKKVDMNLQTSKVMISQTIDNLYCELGGQKPKFTNGGLSSCDEFEDDVESDDDHQKKLIEEQLSLERQIMELQSQEIDVDTETDETDCEAILCDLEDNESSENNDPEGRKSVSSFIDDDMTLEMRYAPMLTDLTQLERAETLATLQELVARDPGRAQKLHLKLSSPSRRRSFHETLKKYQGKQTRAQEKRQALALQKAQKIQQLIQRVEIVKAAKAQLTEGRRLKMEQKIQRATENRENYLKNKIKKAHDEEEKLKEIAFIKNIELQNKRLDLLESNKEQEGRLQDLESERYVCSHDRFAAQILLTSFENF